MVFRRRRSRGDRDEFDRALRRSLRASIDGDPTRAQTWLERAVELDSSDFDAYQALARLYRDRGEIGRAIRMHQNLLLRGDLDREELVRAKLELARDFEAGGFRERALATLEELVGSRPRDPEVIEAMAQAWIESGDRAHAESLVSRLRRVDPDGASRLAARWAEGAATSASERERAGGLVSRFVARFGGRRREDALERTLRARLERDEEDHEARVGLARLERDRGHPERARELLARGLERWPEAWRLHVEQGRLWLASGQDGEALKAYASLIEALDASLARRASNAVVAVDRGGEDPS
jgi:lipopolysaccharide biosynthesis regulator YciM